jgi:hypothetical protein
MVFNPREGLPSDFARREGVHAAINRDAKIAGSRYNSSCWAIVPCPGVVAAVRVIAFSIRDKGVFCIDRNSRDGFLPLAGLPVVGRCDCAICCGVMTLSRIFRKYLTHNVCVNARSTILIYSRSRVSC